MKNLLFAAALLFSLCFSPLSSGEWLPSIQVTPSGQAPIVKLDSQGNAVAIWLSADQRTLVSGVLPRGDRGWQDFPIFNLGGLPGTITSLNLGLDANGDAVAVWLNVTADGNFIFASTLPFGSRTWSSPVFIQPVAINERPNQVSSGVDAAGNTVIVWTVTNILSTLMPIESAVLPFGSTASPSAVYITAFNTFNFQANVAVNASGEAIATWQSDTMIPPAGSGSINAAFFDGTSWQTTHEFQLIPAPFPQTPLAAIDPNGNGVVIWYVPFVAGTATIQSGTFIGGTWSGAIIPVNTTTSTAPNTNPYLQLGVDASGNALITYVNNNTAVVSESLQFGTGVWGNFQVVGVGNPGPDSLVVSPTGQATVTWVDSTTGIVEASMLPGVLSIGWSAPVFLSTTATAGQFTTVAADGLGEFVTVWQETNGSLRSSFFDPNPLPLPPSVVVGSRGINQFLLQKELFAALIIYPAPTPNRIVAYLVFSDSGLTNQVAEVPAGSTPVAVDIHNLMRGPQTFYVVSEDNLGFFSTPVVVTL